MARAGVAFTGEPPGQQNEWHGDQHHQQRDDIGYGHFARPAELIQQPDGKSLFTARSKRGHDQFIHRQRKGKNASGGEGGWMGV